MRTHEPTARAPKIVGAMVLWSLVIASFFACSPAPDTTRVTEILAPSFNPGFSGVVSATDVRSGVSSFLEQRCGTLDCHGQVGRPLRIYSGRGLRLQLDDGGINIPGQGGTTAPEKYANYQAAISIEPEIMTQVQADQGQNPERLLLVRKPRLMERHKGGQIVVPGDSGDTCLISWLQGNPNYDACDKATSIGN
jgi:hypothetical protein